MSNQLGFTVVQLAKKWGLFSKATLMASAESDPMIRPHHRRDDRQDKHAVRRSEAIASPPRHRDNTHKQTPKPKERSLRMRKQLAHKAPRPPC